jgi:hypothetical protein
MTLTEEQTKSVALLGKAHSGYWMDTITTPEGGVYVRATHKECGTPTIYSLDPAGRMFVMDGDPDTMNDHFDRITYLDIEHWAPPTNRTEAHSA